MIELCHQQSGRLLSHAAALAAPCPGSGALEMRRRRQGGGLMRVLDRLPVGFIRQRPKDGDGFRRAERHVPARRMLSRATTLLNEAFPGLGIDAAQHGLELRLRHRPAEAQPLRAFAGPAAGRLSAARVVVVATKMIVISKSRLGAAACRDRRDHDQCRVCRIRSARSGVRRADAGIGAGGVLPLVPFGGDGGGVSVQSAGMIGSRNFGKVM